MKRKILCALIIVTTLTNLALPLSASAFSVWFDLEKPIRDFEDAGDYAAAFPYWVKYVDFAGDSSVTAEYLINGGIFAGRAGDYCIGASEYGSSVFDPALAVTYFKKSAELFSRAQTLTGTNYDWAVVAAERKIARYDTTIQVYVERPVSERKQSRPLALHEPESGMILGIYGERENLFINKELYTVDMNLINSNMGRNHTALLFYSSWGSTQRSDSPFPTEHAERLKPLGGALQIHMQPVGGLQVVQDGEYIRTWARAAKASGIPIFLRFAGEMNGSWTAWDGNPTLYIEKFRLVHDIMAAEAPNVAMVWAPNDFPMDNYAEFYPGDAYVDWVGVSCYMMLTFSADTRESVINADLIYKLSKIVEQYGDRKPLMIVESASGYTSVSEKGVDFTDWAINNMNKYYAYLPRVYPAIKGIFYFGDNDHTGNYRLTENQRILQNYKELIKSDYFMESMDKPAAYFYQEIEKANLSEGTSRLSVYASTYDIVVSKVEYQLKNLANGAVTTLGQVSRMPFELTADFSKLPSANHELIIKVYDSKGVKAAEKSFKLNLSKPSATPTASKVFIDGVEVSFEAYNIGGSNYFKLRDLASAVNGSVKQFKVGYDEATKAIALASGEPYTSVGGEMAQGDGKQKAATSTASEIFLDSKKLELIAYNIGGNNFIKLRDLMKALDIYVGYDNTSKAITLDTNRSYIDE